VQQSLVQLPNQIRRSDRPLYGDPRAVSGFRRISPLDILEYHKNGSEGSMACNKKKDRRE